MTFDCHGAWQLTEKRTCGFPRGKSFKSFEILEVFLAPRSLRDFVRIAVPLLANGRLEAFPYCLGVTTITGAEYFREKHRGLSSEKLPAREKLLQSSCGSAVSFGEE